MRTLVIGDIHGCLGALDRVLASADPQPDDLLITLGDYVDRGPDSSRVLDRLMELRQRTQLVPLQGNHDLMMVAARDDREHFDEWLSCGGDQTLESYGAAFDWKTFAKAMPVEHWRFLTEECLPYYETETHFFVHANAYADLRLSEQPEYMLHWEPLDEAAWRPHESGKTMICGHTAQRSGLPLLLDRAVCIDTRVYGEGWLTCLHIEPGVYWQANQRGQMRIGNLGNHGR